MNAIDPNFDIKRAVNDIIRKEMYYLMNTGWLLYCGVYPDMWAHSSDPKKRMSQREAMNEQRIKDGW